MISTDLIEFLRTQFRLDWHGIHGAPHWARVRYNGFQLAMLNGANIEKACSEHSEGYVRGDITVQTCWDADRLDLGQIGIRPDPQKLCTAEAQSPAVIAAAYRRSLRAGHCN